MRRHAVRLARHPGVTVRPGEHCQRVVRGEQRADAVDRVVQVHPPGDPEALRESDEPSPLARVRRVGHPVDVQRPPVHLRHRPDRVVDPLVRREPRRHRDPEQPVVGQPEPGRRLGATHRAGGQRRRHDETCRPTGRQPLRRAHPAVDERVEQPHQPALEGVVVAHPGRARPRHRPGGRGDETGLDAVPEHEVRTGAAQPRGHLRDGACRPLRPGAGGHDGDGHAEAAPLRGRVALGERDDLEVEARAGGGEPLLPDLGAPTGGRGQHDAHPQARALGLLGDGGLSDHDDR